MKSIEQIINSYYKTQKKTIKNIYDIKKTYSFNYSNNNNKNIIEIINENNETVLKAEYCLAGIYSLLSSIWYWAWNIDMIDRSVAKDSIIVKDYIDNNNDNISDIELERIHYITTNGNFYASGDTVTMCVRLMLYLMKAVWYIPLCHSNKQMNMVCGGKNEDINKIEYIIIKKIL
jgi:hypothetical protein